MVEPKLQIVLQRCDCTRNVARFYVLAIEPSLFGDAALVRAWGRRGSLGRQLKDWALAIAARSTMRKARIALARRLAIIMHAMLRHGTEFKPA
jgi:predicted DNA-binding WGR domain protein